MTNITGQSIAAVSDSVTKNGTRNTGMGAVILVGVILTCAGGAVAGKIWIDNNKRKNAIKLANAKAKNAQEHEDKKHKQKMEELDRKAEQARTTAEHKEELKRQTIELRRATSQGTGSFNPDMEPDSDDASGLVPIYDDVVNGDDVDATDLRLGLRCFHIGQDNGLIGRSNIGKTSFLFALAKAICTNSHEDGAILSPDWCLSQPMKVLYFAFEQNASDFRVKYGKHIKSIPNLHIDVETSAGDFQTIMKKIKAMQNGIGNHRLLVIFDNITKMNYIKGKEKGSFFKWLDNYRQECERKGKPITYLKVFHTQGKYTDDMPIEITTNYGAKADTYFAQNLVGFGVCKGGDGKLRYLKELKNKFEGEKQTLSVYRFADTEAPMYDYVEEAMEVDVLPTKADMLRGGSTPSGNISVKTPRRRGPKEKYTESVLREMYEEKEAGFSWREILESRDIEYSENIKKGIRKAMKRYNIIISKAA